MYKVCCLAAVALIASATMISVAHAQDLLVGDYFTNTIYRVAPDGTKTTYAQPTVPSGIRLDDFALDSAGNLYATRLQGGTANPSDPNNGVIKISPTGVVTNFAIGISGLPVGIVLDASGNVYVGGLQTAAVRKYSPSGVSLGTFATVTSDCESLVFDSSGNLYVGTNANGQIRRFSASGASLGLFATAPGVTSLVFDSAGNLYAGGTTGSIVRFAPDGTSLGTFATVSGAKFDQLTFALNGDLYAANLQTSNGDIRRFGANGTPLGTFSSFSGSPLGLAFLGSAAPEPGTLALLAVPSLLIAGRIVGRRRKRVA